MNERERNRYRWSVALMVLFACLALPTGAAGLKNWLSLSAGTRAYYAALSAAGVVLLLCAARALFAGRLTRAAAWGGLAAATTLGASQVVGLFSNAIPCFTAG